MPPWHWSPAVHASLSLHGLVLLVWTQPVVGLQESVVQRFPSSQFWEVPGWQTPPAHLSFTVHSLPSVQVAVLFCWTQPLAGLHVSSVHGLPSPQARLPVP